MINYTYEQRKLNEDEYINLCRFFETTSDDETYDIDEAMIKDLSNKKAIIHVGFGQYQITEYGLAIIKSMNFKEVINETTAD